MSLQEDIYNKLKTAIIYGEFTPGQKLSEVELASNLSVSRTPIREAFRQLQMEGYITVSPNKSAQVSKLPLAEIEEIYDIITLLEGYAAELGSKRINSSKLNELRQLQKKLTFFASKKNYHDYIEANTTFHLLIAGLSGNSNLVRTINELRTRIYRYRLTSVTIPGYLGKYASDHHEIINSIAKGDSVLARKHMKDHVTFVKKTSGQLFERKSQFLKRKIK